MFRTLLLAAVLSTVSFINAAVAAKQVPPIATLVSQDYVIEASDRSFVMEPGKSLPPPAVVDKVCWRDVHAMAAYGNIYRGPLTDKLDQGIKNGAAAVRVKNTKSGETLYGRLLFCAIHSSQQSYGIQEYKVSIPQNYFDAAVAGDFVAVYAKSFGRDVNGLVWILWLSADEI